MEKALRLPEPKSGMAARGSQTRSAFAAGRVCGSTAAGRNANVARSAVKGQRLGAL